MHEDGCDNCGNVRELYHFDAVVEGNPDDGAALCDACNTLAMVWDDQHRLRAEAEVGPFHAELQALIEGSSNPVLAMHLPPAMIEQAEQLLALPEESVAALVEAARLMVGAAEFGRHPYGVTPQEGREVYPGGIRDI